MRFVVLACGFLAALLLIASEFAQLYSVHTAASRAALQTVTGHTHNTFAMVPIAVFAAFMTYGASRDGSPPALLALVLLGVMALVIALAGDLPDAQASGIVLRGGHYEAASSSPSLGLYLETLGGVLLLIAAGAGLLLGGPAARSRPPRPAPAATPQAGTPATRADNPAATPEAGPTATPAGNPTATPRGGPPAEPSQGKLSAS